MVSTSHYDSICIICLIAIPSKKDVGTCTCVLKQQLQVQMTNRPASLTGPFCLQTDNSTHRNTTCVHSPTSLKHKDPIRHAFMRCISHVPGMTSHKADHVTIWCLHASFSVKVHDRTKLCSEQVLWFLIHEVSITKNN